MIDIIRFLKNYLNIIIFYACGTSKNDIHRHFIVPKDIYEMYKTEAKKLNFSIVSGYFQYKKEDSINMISPQENSYQYKILLMTSYVSTNYENENVEIRNNYEIIKKFTTDQLDNIDKEIQLEFEDDADDTLWSI